LGKGLKIVNKPHYEAVFQTKKAPNLNVWQLFKDIYLNTEYHALEHR